MTGAGRDIFRLARLFLGLFLYAAGVVMTLRANVGYSPWDVFHQGITLHTGITMGQANILVGIAIVFIAVLMKERVGVGTLCNMVSVGVFMDVLLSCEWIPLMRGFVPGLALMICGLFVLGFASVLYIGAGYSAGPRDSLMVVLTKRTGKPVGLCRGCVEGVVLFAGWLLGGYAGIGTVIYVFGISAAVQIVFRVMRFDVKKIHHESCSETFLRLKRSMKPTV